MKKPILNQHIFSYECPLDWSKFLSSIKELPFKSNNNNKTTLDTYIFNKSEFREVKSWAEQCLQEVITEMKYTFQVRITQSWVNRSDRGMWHHAHKHPNSLISGIFYLTPSGSTTWFSCPDIWFSPEPLLPFYSHLSPSSGIIHKFPTTPGTLVLFPSSLTHSVNEHDLNEPRYSLSFNTFPYGTFGSGENLTELIL